MALQSGQEACQLCESKEVKMEGYLLRKVKKKNKLKKEKFSLLGKELYYKKLYILVDVYIIKEKEELFQNELKLYPFTLVFRHKKRTFYLIKESERDEWVRVLMEVIGYRDFFDFYEPGDEIGKGKFGVVKTCVNKQTGKKEAVKIINQTDATRNDLELQKREIDILKICQHPNIIHLSDLFENQTTKFIVMEY
jgi:serine/threonine protein kinase